MGLHGNAHGPPGTSPANGAPGQPRSTSGVRMRGRPPVQFQQLQAPKKPRTKKELAEIAEVEKFHFRDYGGEPGVAKARGELPFLFASFGDAPGLQEYVEYVVTAQGGWGAEYEDFRGFRVVALSSTAPPANPAAALQTTAIGTVSKVPMHVAAVAAAAGDPPPRTMEGAGTSGGAGAAGSGAAAGGGVAGEGSGAAAVAGVAEGAGGGAAAPKPPEGEGGDGTAGGGGGEAEGGAAAGGAAAASVAVGEKRKREDDGAGPLQEGGSGDGTDGERRIVCAACIRAGGPHLEIPFFATRTEDRGQGYARMLLFAIEDIARRVGAHTLTLCSADDRIIRGIWEKLGFRDLPELGYEAMGRPELVKLSNSVMMSKGVPPSPRLATLVVRHGDYVRRSEVIICPNMDMPPPR